MTNFLKKMVFASIICISLLLFLNSCGPTKVKDDSSSNSSSSSTACYTTTPSEKGSCSVTSSLTASTRVPLLLVRVQYKNACLF